MPEQISFCRNCAAHCGVVLDVDDGQIRTVRGDRSNSISTGYVCIKGKMAADLHNGGENRLVECLKRQPDGSYSEIDKQVAVAEIAERLRPLLAEHGPRALSLFFGTTSYFDSVGKPLAISLMAELGSPNIFSTFTVDQSAKWVTAGRMGHYAPGKPTLDKVDAILMSGMNPLISHLGYPSIPTEMSNVNAQFRELKARGIKLVVIDPRRTETAHYATLFIQPKPGYDVAIFSAIIRLVIENGTYDHAFCDRYTANFEALRSAVESFTPEYVADLAGIEADDLREAAKILGSAARASCGSGTGHNMAAFSNTAEHLSEALNAILNGYMRVGDDRAGGVFFPRAGTTQVYPPGRGWERGPRTRDGAYGLLNGEFPATTMPDEILAPGADAIRAMFVMGSNPVMALSDPERTIEALSRLDLLVTFEPRMSATARLAHYIIAPTLQFEREEVSTYSDYCFARPFIQYSAVAKAPPPGCMHESEFFWLLARELGTPLTLKAIPFGGDYSSLEGVPIDMDHMPSREEMLRRLIDLTPVSSTDVMAAEHGLDANIWLTLAEHEDDGARLDLCPADVAEEIAQFRRASRSSRPYLLSVRRVVESFNSSFHGHPAAKRRHPVNHLYIHPDDLADLGGSDGAAYHIASDHGTVTGYAKPDVTMRRGVVSMTHNWGAGPGQSDPYFLMGAHTGRLASMAAENATAINRMIIQSGIPVSLVDVGFDLGAAQTMATDFAKGARRH